ncbi:hypothetical protein ACMFMG_007253 [Clarireedia jacksonii]
MPPLILHNVPEDECYIGEDGVRRPYAMLFPGNDGNPAAARIRRAVPETGSFGKSTRRSRSRTGTPAAKREDPTIAAADAIFSNYLATRTTTITESGSPQRKSSLSHSLSQSNLQTSTTLASIDGNAGPHPRFVHKEPTEVILRGFKPSHQWAAIREYERIGGHVCEDYPRDPPLEQRKYKADLRDQAALRRRPMTLEEKAKALRFAGGEHWIKITFESAEAADMAVEASPQVILGYMIHAEYYRGAPPAKDELGETVHEANNATRTKATKKLRFNPEPFIPSGDRRPQQSALSRSWTTPNMSQVGRNSLFEDRDRERSISPEGSRTSTQTLDTGTLSSSTLLGPVSVSSSTSTVQEAPSIYCRKIPQAQKLQLLPAEQALLPQKSFTQRVISNTPFLSWFSTDIIGNSVPRTDSGEFDWLKASFYWRLIYWIDWWLGIFDVVGGDKDE